jgi:hypothetical protein
MDKFYSKYSNGKSVSAAQYITELVCENKAQKDKLDLHYRFWTTKSWEKYYKDQIASANKLIKKYTAKAIIAALRSHEGQKIYSLRAPFLVPIIEKQQKILDKQNTVLTKDLNRKEKTVFRNNVPKNNIISRLEELE